MLITRELERMLNEQINLEFYAAYIYLAMSNWAKENGYDGFALWLRKQYEEEISHANRIIDFVHEIGGCVELKPIDAPNANWNSLEEIFAEAYEHEKKVTDSFYNMMKVCREIGDYASEIIVSEFIKEQIEEENSFWTILDKIRKIQNGNGALLILDEKLGKRE